MLSPGCHAQALVWGPPGPAPRHDFTREGVAGGGGLCWPRFLNTYRPAPTEGAAAVAGHTGDAKSARAALADPASEVRASALGALARLRALEGNDVVFALADPAAEVRRRACDLAGRLHMVALAVQLCVALADGSPPVVEAACYALGELAELSGQPGTQAAVVARLVASSQPAIKNRSAGKPLLRR